MNITSEMVTAEIVGLHVDFEEWFHGTSESLDQVEAVLADGFVFVGPSGMAIDRAGVLGFLEGGKGSNDVVIRIQNVNVAWQRGPLVGVTYEEWQTSSNGGAEQTTGRISTAVLEFDESAPRLFRWLSVHETWLPGQGPSTD